MEDAHIKLHNDVTSLKQLLMLSMTLILLLLLWIVYALNGNLKNHPLEQTCHNTVIDAIEPKHDEI